MLNESTGKLDEKLARDDVLHSYLQWSAGVLSLSNSAGNAGAGFACVLLVNM